LEGKVRKASIRDAQRIQFLINEYAKLGLMLPRSIQSIYENIRDFWVYEEGGEVLGVCALTIFWSDLAEVRSLAVAPGHTGKGIGTALVKRALEEAHIGITPGVDFGSNDTNLYIRLSYANTLERLKEGMERLKAWLPRA